MPSRLPAGPAASQHELAARRIRLAILTVLVVVSTTTLSPPTALGETDGAVPEDVRVFDDDIPAVANLEPGPLRALRHAAMDATKTGSQSLLTVAGARPLGLGTLSIRLAALSDALTSGQSAGPPPTQRPST